MEEGARRPGTPAIDRELLEEFYSRGHMNCKFGQQLRDWGRQTQATVWRARRAGIPIDVIRDVLEELHPDICAIVTMRSHFNGECRCPKRR